MVSTKKQNFANSEEVGEALRVLEAMVLDKAYHTEASFSANGDLYPDHVMPFVDKHMNYLKSHPGMNPQQYISNLRLMTRVR